MKRILMTTAIVAAMGTGMTSTAWAEGAASDQSSGQSSATTQMSADAGASSGTVFASDVSQQSVKNDVMASALIGKDIYIPKSKSTSDNGGSGDSASNSTQMSNGGSSDTASNPKANLDDVGQVGDVILTKEGKVDAVLVDVGGFLGIGSHTVALSWDALQWKMPANAKSTSDSYLVVNASRDQLEKAPAFKKSWLQQTADNTKDMANSAANKTANAADNAADATSNMASNAADATSNMANSAAQKTADAANSAKQGMNSMADKAGDKMAGNDSASDAKGSPMAKAKADGYTTADTGSISTKKLQGASVYDSKGDNIGEVSKLVMDPSSNKVNGAVVDVGGFLGIGEKPVKLSMDQLHVMTKQDSDDVRVYVSQTEAQLKKMPTYKEKS
ncbi:PRC-barrel domain-containing protein [Acidimangrovimonas sediminis]|uniref:PRC-barrel domain-containing protein n=1 Tax=Acidimangrovimonas sediminis TaxID=2056283 RepID=UPI000C803C15|nr:PRC-barrel domain-containing protein [Acidimangrovimonas sediminis]